MSDIEEIETFMEILAQRRLPNQFSYGSISIKKAEGRTVYGAVEVTFKIERNRVLKILPLALNVGFDGVISFDIKRNPVLVRLETPLSEEYTRTIERLLAMQ